MNISTKNKLLAAALFSATMAAFSPALASAATLYFSVPAGPVPVGVSFPVTLLIDSDQPVNAYATHVSLSGGAVQYDSSNNAGSLITVWQSTPIAAGNTVAFDGGSFQSFIGKGGQLMTLDLTAVATGTTQLNVKGSNVYLANGKGTKEAPATQDATITVVPAGPGVVYHGPTIDQTDLAPPVVSYLSFIPDPFDAGQKLLGFSVADAISGVKETDARYRSGIFWSDWQAVKNPAPFQNSVWEIEFQAIDNAGNINETTLYDWNALFWSVSAIAVTILAFIMLVYVIIKVLK